MNKYAQELRDRYNAEEVCGSLITNVDGKRQIIAFYDHAKCELTTWGQKLEAQTVQISEGVEVLPTVSAKRKPGRPPKRGLLAAEDPQNELDLSVFSQE